MSQVPSAPARRDLASGDRIRIRQGERPLSELVGHIGTVVETFRLPAGSCLVLIDGDLDRREWFFYHDEIALTQA
jgi:hypothetical protein